MDALIKAESGAKRVVVFDHTLRTADDACAKSENPRAVQRAHNDYTERSGPQRLKRHRAGRADELLKRRFAIIQVWRPIRYPVETHPLAIADARRVSTDFVCQSAVIRTGSARPMRSPTTRSTSGTGCRARRATRRWFSRSRIREGRPRPLDPATAFDDPTTPPNTRPRDRIEIRTLAFF